MIKEISKEEMNNIVSQLPKNTNILASPRNVDKSFIERRIFPIISEKVKSLITTARTIEELNVLNLQSRSERDEKIIVELLFKGFGEYIRDIFENYPCGDKYKEHASGEEYLSHQIESAREYTGVRDDLFLKLLSEIDNSNEEYITNKIEYFLKEVLKLTEPLKLTKVMGLLAVKTKISKKDLNKRLVIIRNSQYESKPISILDLLKKETPNISYYVAPYIPKNCVIMFAGKAGNFKSMCILAIALSVLDNKPFLNTFAVMENPRILYYDLENGDMVFKDRLTYLINGLGINTQNLNNFHVEFNFNKNNLEKELELAKSYDIIVLDSYRRFLEGTENDSEITDKFFREYLKVLKEQGKTLIILHHLKKSKSDNLSDEDIIDMFRGSTDIAAQLDIAYKVFTSNEKVDDANNNSFTVSVSRAKNRLGLPLRNFSFNVLKDDINKKTSLTFNDFNVGHTLKPKEKAKEEIVKKVGEIGELEHKELINIFSEDKKYSVPSLNRWLGELKTEGILEGDYGKYSLPEKQLKPDIKEDKK